MFKIIMGLFFIFLLLIYFGSMMKKESMVHSNDEQNTPVINIEVRSYHNSKKAPIISNTITSKGLESDIVTEELSKKEGKEAAFLKRMLEEEATIQTLLDNEANDLGVERREPYTEESLIEPPDVHSATHNSSDYEAMNPELGSKLIADAEFVINDFTKKRISNVQPDAVLDTDNIERGLEKLFGFESAPTMISDGASLSLPPDIEMPELMDVVY